MPTIAAYAGIDKEYLIEKNRIKIFQVDSIDPTKSTLILDIPLRDMINLLGIYIKERKIKKLEKQEPFEFLGMSAEDVANL